MTLGTVADYVAQARIPLQDQVEPFRYATDDLVQALNMSVMQARRIRPDLFLKTFSSLPSFSAADTTPVEVDPQYRVAFLYFIVGHAQLRDEEDTQDARAAAFINKFVSQLVSVTG